ncbi:MAG: hypothetical protein NVSMB25_16670 [Thermoleophilaceae bacterium]
MLAILVRVLYWVAVLVAALAILVALVSLLESRDSSQVGRPVGAISLEDRGL